MNGKHNLAFRSPEFLTGGAFQGRVSLEALRHQPLIEALSRRLRQLAKKYAKSEEEAIFIRVAFEGGYVDGWYRPRDGEFEPTKIAGAQLVA